MNADQPPFLPRLQASQLRAALATMRVVVLTGARQTGKTTLAQELGREDDRVFITLDRPEILELAERDPEALWEGLERLTIDEVQRSPQLLNLLKIEVDRNPAKGRFLLTGSANLLLMESVSESLAGRAGYISLPPFTLAERMGTDGGRLLRLLLEVDNSASALKLGTDFPSRDVLTIPRAVFDGGYPEALQLDSDQARNIWREGYVATYLERDLRNLSAIADLPDFLRLLRLAVLRSGQLVNIDGLARDAGLASSTARRWLNLLEVSCQTVSLPAYATSRSKRLIKSPKLYPTDSGLACYLCGISEAVSLESFPQLGSLFEAYVLQHLTTFAALLPVRAGLLYWRTTRGEEVDFVVETPNRLLPIEVKTSRSIGKRDLRGLKAFLGEYPDGAPFGIVLYAGQEWLRPARNVVAIPWATFLGN
jgi:predicted AAA+ superfamily ATPase